MTDEKFELVAEFIVDQHYASGPAEMKQVVAEALEAAAGGSVSIIDDPRKRLQQEVAEATQASALGSE